MNLKYMAAIALCLCCGCSKQDSVDEPTTSADRPAAQDERGNGDIDSASTRTPLTNSDVKEELDSWIDELDGSSHWHYGERTDGELAGVWIAEDRSGHRLVFGADGSFSEDFNGELTAGLFAISDEGRIAAFSARKGINLRSHFRFDGTNVIGPKGPDPTMKWSRRPKTDEAD